MKLILSFLPIFLVFSAHAERPANEVSMECIQEPYAVTAHFNGRTADFKVTKSGVSALEGHFSESQIQHGFDSSLLNAYIIGMVDEEQGRVFGIAVPGAHDLLTTPGEYSAKADLIFVLPNNEAFDASTLDCMVDVE